MSSKPASDDSPERSRTITLVFAVAILGLLALALFSLSKISSNSWPNSLKAPNIQDTLRQDLPQIEDPELVRLMETAHQTNRWVLLSFWSVTCPPCLAEMPNLNALGASWQGPGFQVVTVNVDAGVPEDLEQAKRFLQEEQITLPSFYDHEDKLKRAFQVSEFPKHFLIAPDRKIVWSAIGAFQWNDPKARDQLLKLMERRSQEPAADPAE